MSVAERLLAWARLLRLSNGPTAVADVWMGYAVTTGDLSPTYALIWMTVASLSLYHGGMVLNDAFDAETDAAAKRSRPIELGLIGQSSAFMLAAFLLCLGLLISVVLVGIKLSTIPLALAAAVVAYNSKLKASWLGPVLMGCCRLLNVHLGYLAVVAREVDFSLAPKMAWASMDPFPCVHGAAVVIGLYVVGVTWFARNEVVGQPRLPLTLATTLSLCAMAWGAFAMLRPTNVAYPSWAVAWAAAAMVGTRGMAAAILQPTPKNIGRGVGIAIQGLVVIDATLATLYAGPVAGLAILALLPVTMFLSQWIPQT